MLKILVIPLRFIGDAVLTVPLLRALCEQYPEAQVDLLLPPHLINLLERCPYVSELQTDLKGKHYDMAFLLRRSMSQALQLKLSGIQQVIGYDEQRFPPPVNFQRWGWFLDHRVSFPPGDTDIPQVKTYLNLLSPLTSQSFDERLELWADEADRQKIQAYFDEGILQKPLAILHATSASQEKAMAAEPFLPALQALHQAGFQIAAIGTEKDYSHYEGLPLINLCGQTTLRQTYALLQQSQFLLSLDSGPVHMAACANIPHMVVIYGHTNEKQWRPYPYSGKFTAVFSADKIVEAVQHQMALV